jgi:hypothetical protein
MKPRVFIIVKNDQRFVSLSFDDGFEPKVKDLFQLREPLRCTAFYLPMQCLAVYGNMLMTIFSNSSKMVNLNGEVVADIKIIKTPFLQKYVIGFIEFCDSLVIIGWQYNPRGVDQKPCSVHDCIGLYAIRHIPQNSTLLFTEMRILREKVRQGCKTHTIMKAVWTNSGDILVHNCICCCYRFIRTVWRDRGTPLMYLYTKSNDYKSPTPVISPLDQTRTGSHWFNDMMWDRHINLLVFNLNLHYIKNGREKAMYCLIRAPLNCSSTEFVPRDLVLFSLAGLDKSFIISLDNTGILIAIKKRGRRRFIYIFRFC